MVYEQELTHLRNVGDGGSKIKRRQEKRKNEKEDC